MYRAFFSIELPDAVKQQLAASQAAIRTQFNNAGEGAHRAMRYVAVHNLHVTLLFLGQVSKQQLAALAHIADEVAARHMSFDISADRLSYRPQHGVPKQVEVTLKLSLELKKLQRDIVKSVINHEAFAQSILQQRTFRPHMTLARIRQWAFRKIEPEDAPVIDETYECTVPVGELAVVTSQLKRHGPVYAIAHTAQLNQSAS